MKLTQDGEVLAENKVLILYILNKIENPINVMDFKLTYLKKNKNLEDNIEYADYILNVLKEVKKIDDIILKNLTLQKLSEESHLGLDILKEKLENMSEPQKEVKIEEPEIKNKEITTAAFKAEQSLMYYLIQHKEVVTIFNNNKVFLQTDRFRKLALEVKNLSREGDIQIADLLIEFANNEEYKKTVSELLSLNLKDEYTKEEILGYIYTIKLNNIKKERIRLNDLLHHTIDKKEKEEIAKKIIELKQEEQEIKKEGYYGK